MLPTLLSAGFSIFLIGFCIVAALAAVWVWFPPCRIVRLWLAELGGGGGVLFSDVETGRLPLTPGPGETEPEGSSSRKISILALRLDCCDRFGEPCFGVFGLRLSADKDGAPGRLYGFSEATPVFRNAFPVRPDETPSGTGLSADKGDLPASDRRRC